MLQLANKHMDLFTRKSLSALIASRSEPSVSVYMPMERMGREVQQNAIRFKNAMKNVEQQLAAYDIDHDSRDAMLSQLESLDDETFWQHQSDGLAIFATMDSVVSYRLPQPFDMFVEVGSQFVVTPLLPLVNANGRFYVLALSQNDVRLLQGTRFQVGEVELNDAPQSLADTLRYDVAQRSLRSHQAGGGGDTVYHIKGRAVMKLTKKRTSCAFSASWIMAFATC